MKIRSFAFALAILFAAFTINSSIMAQSHDSKSPENKGKTTATTTTHDKTNKTEGSANTVNKQTNTNPQKDVKKTENQVKYSSTTATHNKTTKTEGGANTVNKEAKTNHEKDMNKTENQVKHKETTNHKSEQNKVKK